jgi:O-antigen ligase
MATIVPKKEFRESVAQVLLYAALITPLIVGSSFSIFPFIFPKVMYFEIVAGLLAAVLTPIILKKKLYSVTNIYAYAMGTYAVVLGISGITAFDSSRAFWSNFERMTGIVFIWFAILFSVLVTAYFSANINKLRGFLSYLVGISVVVAFSGIIQRFDSTFLMHQGTRVAGTFGNPIYLGGFCAQLALIAGYLAYINRDKAVKWWYLFAVLANSIAIYLSGTRSALVGLFGALVIIGMYGGSRLWMHGKKQLVVSLLIGIGAVVGILFALPHYIPSLQGTMLERMTNVSSALSTTGSTRLIAWKIAIKGFLERPVFGWGPENFFFVFNKYYDPKSLLHGSYETWFDHAHNAVFDVLVTQGFVGFAVYLFQYGLILWMCYKTRSADENENILSVVLAGIFVLHFIHNFFVFDHPGSYVEFYALGAIVAARYVVMKRTQVLNTNEPQIRNVGEAAGHMVSVAAILLTVYVVVPSFRQNYLDLKAQVAAGTDLNVTQKYFKEALAVNGPHMTDVLMDVGRIGQRIPLVVNGGQSFLSIPMFKNYYDFTFQSLDQVISKYEPGNVLAAIMKGQLLMNVAQTGNVAAIEEGSAAFKYATSLSPDRQQIAYSWAHLLLMKNDVAGAKKLLEGVNAKEPGIGIGHWYLALIYIDTEPEKAADEVDLALKNGHNITAPENRLLAGLAYKRAGRTQKAVELFTLGINDAATRNWNAELVLAADSTLAEMKLVEEQKKLRALFPEVFKIKK